MATPDGKDEDSQPPGFAMNLTIAGISKKFPSVRNISTGMLAAWQRPLTVGDGGSLIPQTGPKTTTDTGALDVDQSREGQGGEVLRKLVVLDSRPVEEFCVGHIPGSIRVDYEAKPEDIASSIPELAKPDEPTTVVCYCSVGYRSSMVAKKLQEFYKKAGDTGPKVYNLEGSIFQWANEGRVMVDGNDRVTKYTHPYNAVFGKLLNKELRQTEMETASDSSNKL